MLRKKITSSFIAIVIVLNCFAQTADEIVSKYVDFTGGKDAWVKVNTITSSGTYNYGGAEFPFQSFSKRPDLYRYIVSFKGKSFEQAFNGKEGWRIDGFKKETKKTVLTGKNAKAMANESDVELESPFINYKTKGHQLKYEGKDSVNHHLCYKIKLTRKDGAIETWFFDAENYALLKKEAIAKNTELDHSALDIFYSDYKPVDSVFLPFRITCKTKGQTVLDITINEVKLNEEVADAMFNP
ncbi:MAG: DUF4292 domain-containing protein [Chitinophagaceae bacterium]